MYKNKAKLFNLFWENSKINRFNVREFGEQLAEFGRHKELSPQLFYPKQDIKLVKPDDSLAKIFRQRKSTREFSKKALNKKYLNNLFYCFSETRNNLRVIPSAGARYPIEVFALFYNVKKIKNAVYYYNPDTHSLSFVSGSKSWEKEAFLYNFETKNPPAIVFVFVGFLDRVSQKYGERGGRFLLIEAGHYAQTLGIRLAYDNLAGVELGGIMDEEMKKKLKLQGTDAKILLGFAMGNFA